jgi:hypothetical protein
VKARRESVTFVGIHPDDYPFSGVKLSVPVYTYGLIYHKYIWPMKMQKNSSTFSLLILTTLYIFSAFILTYKVLPQLAGEDGVIEYFSALIWFIGLLIASSILYSGRFEKRFIIIVFLSLCFFSMGEEISWGQRILNIDTPESIANANLQGEFNFHNLEIVSGKYSWLTTFKTGEFHYQQVLGAQNMFRLGFFTFFFIFPILVMIPSTRNILNSIGYYKPPTYFTTLLIIYLIASFLIVIGQTQLLKHAITELREMSYAIFIALYLYLFQENAPVKEHK